MRIEPSKIWKNDPKMPKIIDLTDNNDNDDQKDDEKVSQIKFTKCDYCQFQNNNINNNDDMDDDMLLSSSSKSFTAITDDEWTILDTYDDCERENIDMIVDIPKYKQIKDIKNNNIFDLWKQRHSPHRFREKLFKLVSLRFIQSICSVLKNHINNNNNKPIIIAVSNQQKLYKKLFKLKNNAYTSTNSKSFSNLFNIDSDITRIDSHGSIYNINIPLFNEKIISCNYLHSFVSMSTIKYPSTLLIFTRLNSNNIYISHSGYISKLSLSLNNEDLYYFLPLFIPLGKGEHIDISSFSTPDNGTIVSYSRNNRTNKDKYNIYYRVRSSENVFYCMNYYKLTNRITPQIYYTNTRKTLLNTYWDDKLLSKQPAASTDIDPSDQTHPFHAIILALIESSKQALSSIEDELNNNNNKQQNIIQNILKNVGLLFLFYKSVKILPKTKDVLEFEKEQNEQNLQQQPQNVNNTDNYDDVDDNSSTSSASYTSTTTQSVCSDNDTLNTTTTTTNQLDPNIPSDPDGLHNLITFLENEKLIYNVRKYDNDQEISYFDFCSKSESILKNGKNNKIYLCHMVETKCYQLETITKDKKDSSSSWDDMDGTDDDFASNSNYTDDDDDADDDDDDDDEEKWLTYEPDENFEPISSENLPKKRVIISSSFVCKIKYEFEMNSVYNSNILTVFDLMKLITPERDWVHDDYRLLSKFNEFNIYNQFDLLNTQLINDFKNKMSNFYNQSNNSNNKYNINLSNIRLERFQIKLRKFLNSVPNILKLHKINNPLIQNVIPGVKVTRNAQLLQEYLFKYQRSLATNLNDSTIIISYNPIQSVVVTCTMIRDVTHPIHLYRAAYDSSFYPLNQLSSLNSEWMETSPKHANIITALSTLLRYNKKYEIVLVPSSIHLDRATFLDSQCSLVAPDHEAIADHQITFIYRGLLYRFDKRKSKKYMQKLLKISISSSSINNNNNNKIFVDEIKFLIKLLRANITENIFADSLDPIDSNNCNYRLRGSIKRKHNDLLFRWLNIGCGSCFLHESSGKAKEIGEQSQQSQSDLEENNNFPFELQKIMFLNYIDCRVPFNENLIKNDSKCSICHSLIINPANIGNNKCCHIFCKLCIKRWYCDCQLKSFKNRQKCPVCRSKIIEIKEVNTTKQQAINYIPTTIYQQIKQENISRYRRQYLHDKYNVDREKLIQENIDQQQRPLVEAYANNTLLAHADAGYM